MRKLIQAFRFQSLLFTSLSQIHHPKPCKSLLSFVISSSAFSHNRAYSTTPDQNARNSLLADYLIGSLKFSKDRALSFSSSFLSVRSLDKPKEVVHFFKALGFSDAHIQSMARLLPDLLFAKVEKTLKPKVIFFQELGLSGPRLGSLICRNPLILKCSVDRTLKPCIHLIKKVLRSDGRYQSEEQVNDDLFRILARCNRLVHMKGRIEENILYLESCGVAGSQLSSLLLRRPRLFGLPKEKLDELVSRAVDMNFTRGSRMLVHAIFGLSCLSIDTFNGRVAVFMMFGFSKDEVASMFRKSPSLFRLSNAKLRSRLEFFLNNLKTNKLSLVQNPTLLTLSDGRVISRCNVLKILKSRKLSTKKSSSVRAMQISNQQFVEQYILPFGNDAEELLLAYEGKPVDTSEK